MKKLSGIVFFSLLFYVVAAQQKENKFAKTDAFVLSLGALEAFNVATIADTLTAGFADKEQKARAIFFWIANNIALDPKAVRANDNKQTDPVLVIQNRKTTPLGFSLLVQEMCSTAGIRCLSVDGFIRNNFEDINNKADEFNYSWNVIQLGKSPEEWHYADAAKASGSLDKKLTTFTKRYTEGLFFPDKTLFNLDHYPDNSAWLLGEGSKSLKDFYALPIIRPLAYEMGMSKPTPATGYFKTTTAGTTRFTFRYNEKKPVTTMYIILGDGNKQSKPETVDFSDGGGQISFSYKFKRDDIYPVKIFVNGEELLQYNVEVTE